MRRTDDATLARTYRDGVVSEMLTDEPASRAGPSDAVLAVSAPRRFIDLIPHPACVVDAMRHVHELNLRAEALLAGGEQLSLRAGRLHCQSPDASAELDRYLERPAPGDGALNLRFSRRARARDLIVRVERGAMACARCHGDEPRFLVHMFLPTDRWSIPEELLHATYGLTRREARVIHLLLLGTRVTSVARELGLSTETVRTHLKHAMRKLEVSTQLQLVQVLASGPWR